MKVVAPAPETPPRVSLKRSLPLDDDEIIDLEPTPKRVKSGPSTKAMTSPSKKRRLEEDGLILMDGANDQLGDDVIEID